MAKFEKDNIIFSGINENSLVIGQKISASRYVLDNNDNVIFNTPIINAIDIDWNNAYSTELDEKIKTSADIIKILGNVYSASKNIPTNIYQLEGSNALLTFNDVESLKPQLTGKSAYDIAKETYEDLNHTIFPYQTEAEWVASLKGLPGDRGIPGVNGKSAYEIAQQYYQSIGREFPYTSEEQWISAIMSGNDTKEYTDQQIANINEDLTNKILNYATQLQTVETDHLIVKFLETANVEVGENGEEILTYKPPYKYEISLKDIASEAELNNLKNIVDSMASTELTERINQRIDEILNGASESFDTLKEVEDWINNLPMNPVEVSDNILNLLDDVQNLRGELTEEVESTDQQGNIIYITRPKTYEKTGDEYASSLGEINDIINELLNTVSTAKDVQDGAEENLIDSIIGEDQSFTVNGGNVLAKFINVNKPEGSKVVTLGINKELLINLLDDNKNQTIDTIKTYVNDKLSWKVVE